MTKKKNYNPLDTKEERIKRIQESKARMDQVRAMSSIYTFQNQFYTVYEKKEKLIKQLLNILKSMK